MPITSVSAEPIEGRVRREVAICSALPAHVVGNYVLVPLSGGAGGRREGRAGLAGDQGQGGARPGGGRGPFAGGAVGDRSGRVPVRRCQRRLFGRPGRVGGGAAGAAGGGAVRAADAARRPRG